MQLSDTQVGLPNPELFSWPLLVVKYTIESKQFHFGNNAFAQQLGFQAFMVIAKVLVMPSTQWRTCQVTSLASFTPTEMFSSAGTSLISISVWAPLLDKRRMFKGTWTIL